MEQWPGAHVPQSHIMGTPPSQCPCETLQQDKEFCQHETAKSGLGCVTPHGNELSRAQTPHISNGQIRSHQTAAPAVGKV